MLRGLWSAASGMGAQKMQIDVIANNLANVNTAGFKKSRTDFQDLMYQTTATAGSESSSGDQKPTGIQVGMGTMPVGVQKMFMQGDFQQTENEFDLAIEGDGFFQVLSNDEEYYTRAGNEPSSASTRNSQVKYSVSPLRCRVKRSRNSGRSSGCMRLRICAPCASSSDSRSRRASRPARSRRRGPL